MHGSIPLKQCISLLAVIMLSLQPGSFLVDAIGGSSAQADTAVRGENNKTFFHDQIPLQGNRSFEKTPDLPPITRGSSVILENHSMGGSWFDDFHDETGLAGYDDFKVRSGKVEMDWWDFDWNYRQDVSIRDESGRNLTDYPVEIRLNLTNFDYTKADANGSDIRFVDGDERIYKYWIEKWNASGESRIRINIPIIPANGVRTVWMYYGNPMAQSESNGSAVFSVFEDCSGTELTGKLISYTYGSATNTLVPNYQGSLRSTRTSEVGLDGYAIMSRDIYYPGTSISYDQWAMYKSVSYYDAMDARILLVAPNYDPRAPVAETIYLSYSINQLTPVLQAAENTGAGNSLFENTSVIREWKVFRNFRINVLDDNRVELYYKNEFQSEVSLNNSLEHGFYVIFGYYNAANTGLGNGHAFEFYLDNFTIRNYVSPAPQVQLGLTEHANPTASLESVTVELPESYIWSFLGLGKTEPEGTRLNITILDTATNTTIQGFENISAYSADLSDLNISSIRLQAWFTANGSRKPALELWGLEWRVENAWRDSFITLDRLEDNENLTAEGSLSLAANTAFSGTNVSAAWHFDERIGKMITDASGNGNHGEFAGPTRSNGFFGGGLKFDGSEDRVNAGDLGIFEQLTVEMRIKPDFPANDSSQMLYRLFTGNGTAAMYNTINDSFMISNRVNDSKWIVTGGLPGAGSVRILLESSDGTIYAGTTPNGDVFKSTDSGASWTNTGNLVGATNVSSLIQVSGGTIYAGTLPDGKIFKTNPGALNWVDMGTVGTQSPHSVNCLMESSRGLLYAGTEGVPGEVYLSRDGGASWEATGPFPAGTLAVNSLLESSDGSIFAGTNYLGSIFRSRDGGDTWQATVYEEEPLIVHTLLETDNGVILAGGELPYKGSGARVYRSENGGGSWNMTTLDIPGHAVHSLVETYDGTIYAGTGDIESGIVKSTDQGRTWSFRASLGGGETYSLMESSFGRFYAGTSATGGVFEVPTNVIGSEPMRFSADRWIHLAFVVDERNTTVYTDGLSSGSTPLTFSCDLTDFRIGGDMYSQESDGGHSIGMQNSSFRGIVDEVVIYDRAMGPKEMADRAASFRNHSAFRSANIPIPQNYTWNVFHATSLVANETSLNLSLHDAVTREALVWDNGTAGEMSLNLIEINVSEHPVVYLKGYMRSNRTVTPLLNDWSLNWTPMRPPRLILDIPDLATPEENLTQHLLDLKPYFSDRYSRTRDPVYTVMGFDNINITVETEGHWLNVISLSVNWTGSAIFMVNCTNLYGLSTTSNTFNITVFELNDPPVWNKSPPAIVTEEELEMTSYYSLDSYVADDEKDSLDFNVTCNDANIFASLDGSNHITVIPRKDFFGTAIINATVFEARNRSNSSSISVPVTVSPVNDPPVVTLAHPANNSTIFFRDVPLSWDFFDVDDDAENSSFEVYLSKSDPPRFYMGGLKSPALTVRDLEDGATYYWYVVGNDGKNSAETPNGTWRFTVNTSALPQVRLISPENAAIVNSSEVNLSWRVINPLPSMTYQIYLGREKNTLEELDNTTKKWFLLTNLEDKSVYWWKVVPRKAEIEGICASGVWNFTLDSSYEVLYNMDIHFENDDIEIIRGRNATFNFTLVNLGNTDVEVKLAVMGPLTEHVYLNRSVTVPRGGRTTVKLTFFNTSSLDTGEYLLNISAVFVGGKREGTINARVTNEVVGPGEDDDDDTDDRDGVGGRGLGWLWLAGGISVLILLVLLLFLLFRRKYRRKAAPVKEDEGEMDRGNEDQGDHEDEDKEEVLEPEIEYIPPLGTGEDVTEEAQETELEPTGVHYGYTRKSESGGPVVVSSDNNVRKGGGRIDKRASASIPGKMPSKAEMKSIERVEDGDYERLRKGLSTETNDMKKKARVAPAEKSVSCSICFGIVKTGLPLVTCSCGKKYHHACFERVEECPNCGIGISEIVIHGEENSSNDISNNIRESIAEEELEGKNVRTVKKFPGDRERENKTVFDDDYDVVRVRVNRSRKTKKIFEGDRSPAEEKSPVEKGEVTNVAELEEDDFHIEL